MTNKDLLREIEKTVDIYYGPTTGKTMLTQEIYRKVKAHLKERGWKPPEEVEEKVKQERERIINYMENVLQGNPMISLAEMVGLIKASKPVEGVKHG